MVEIVRMRAVHLISGDYRCVNTPTAGRPLLSVETL